MSAYNHLEALLRNPAVVIEKDKADVYTATQPEDRVRNEMIWLLDLVMLDEKQTEGYILSASERQRKMERLTELSDSEEMKPKRFYTD